MEETKVITLDIISELVDLFKKNIKKNMKRKKKDQIKQEEFTPLMIDKLSDIRTHIDNILSGRTVQPYRQEDGRNFNLTNFIKLIQVTTQEQELRRKQMTNYIDNSLHQMNIDLKETLGTHISNTTEDSIVRVQSVITQHFDDLTNLIQEKEQKILSLEYIIQNQNSLQFEIQYLKGQLDLLEKQKEQHDEKFHHHPSHQNDHQKEESKKEKDENVKNKGMQESQGNEVDWSLIFNDLPNPSKQRERLQTIAQPPYKPLVNRKMNVNKILTLTLYIKLTCGSCAISIKEILESELKQGIEWIGAAKQSQDKDFDYYINVKIDQEKVNIASFIHDLECNNKEDIKKIIIANIAQ